MDDFIGPFYRLIKSRNFIAKIRTKFYCWNYRRFDRSCVKQKWPFFVGRQNWPIKSRDKNRPSDIGLIDDKIVYCFGSVWYHLWLSSQQWYRVWVLSPISLFTVQVCVYIIVATIAIFVYVCVFFPAQYGLCCKNICKRRLLRHVQR